MFHNCQIKFHHLERSGFLSRNHGWRRTKSESFLSQQYLEWIKNWKTIKCFVSDVISFKLLLMYSFLWRFKSNNIPKTSERGKISYQLFQSSNKKSQRFNKQILTYGLKIIDFKINNKRSKIQIKKLGDSFHQIRSQIVFPKTF
jgi:hypothetical protein